MIRRAMLLTATMAAVACIVAAPVAEPLDVAPVRADVVPSCAFSVEFDNPLILTQRSAPPLRYAVSATPTGGADCSSGIVTGWLTNGEVGAQVTGTPGAVGQIDMLGGLSADKRGVSGAPNLPFRYGLYQLTKATCQPSNVMPAPDGATCTVAPASVTYAAKAMIRFQADRVMQQTCHKNGGCPPGLKFARFELSAELLYWPTSDVAFADGIPKSALSDTCKGKYIHDGRNPGHYLSCIPVTGKAIVEHVIVQRLVKGKWKNFVTFTTKSGDPMTWTSKNKTLLKYKWRAVLAPSTRFVAQPSKALSPVKQTVQVWR